MKIKVFFRALFTAIILVIGQLSFGMERELVPLPVCQAPIITQINLGKTPVKGAAFNPVNKKEIFLQLSEGCRAYNIQSEDITSKELSDNKELIRYNRSTQTGPYAIKYDKNTVTIIHRATNTPLYTVKHDDIIKVATFDSSWKQIITVSHDNEVKVSTIKTPIIIECNGATTACNPDIVCTSQTIKKMITFEKEKQSIEPTLNFDETFGQADKINVNFVLQLMALVHKNDVSAIELLLKNTDVDSLCELLEISSYFDIANHDINLTDIICKIITDKYKGQSCIEELPFYPQKMIAQCLVEDFSDYIEHHSTPKFCLDLGVAVRSISLDQNGKIVATGGSGFTQKGANIAQVWDVTEKRLLRTFVGHTDVVDSVHLSSDGKYLATGSKDNTAKLWDVETGACLKTFDEQALICSVVLSDDACTLKMVYTDGAEKLWDIGTENCLYAYYPDFSVQYRKVEFCDSRIILKQSTDELVSICEAKTGKCLLEIGLQNRLDEFAVAFNPNNKTLVVGYPDGTIKIWNYLKKEVIQTLNGHTGRISFVAINSDGSILVSQSWDATKRIWDIKTGRCLHSIEEKSSIKSVAFKDDGKTVAIGTVNGYVKLWNIENTAKQKFLNNVTLKQADFLKKVYPFIKGGKKFTCVPKETEILEEVLPEVRERFAKHIQEHGLSFGEPEYEQKLSFTSLKPINFVLSTILSAANII